MSTSPKNNPKVKIIRDLIASAPDKAFRMNAVFVDAEGRSRNLVNNSSHLTAMVETRGHGCNTATCILGWGLTAAAMGLLGKGTQAEFDHRATVEGDLYKFGASQFGFVVRNWHREADDELFMPEGWEDEHAPCQSKAAALRVLDILFETGEVDWPQAIATQDLA